MKGSIFGIVVLGAVLAGAAEFPSPILAAGGGRAILVGTDGRIVWQARNCGNITQVCLKDGWVYYSNSDLWRIDVRSGRRELVYRPCPRDGLYGFDLLANGNVVVAENGTGDIAELAAGTTNAIVRFRGNVRDPAGCKPAPHHHYRLIHKTAAGTYLVCCSGANCVREYDRYGRLVWEQVAPRLPSGHSPLAFDALRRANGNTLIAHLGGVTEYTPDHRAVWSIRTSDFPRLRLDNLCGLQELPDGNLVIGTYANGRRDGSRVTAFEITREKKIVWSYAATGDRSMMTARRIDPAVWPKR